MTVSEDALVGGELEPFLQLSSVLTGWDVFRLQGTGQAASCLGAMRSVVGADAVHDLLDAHRRIRARFGDDDERRDLALRAEVLSDPRLGPIARNVIKMWFVGTWYQLPAAWRDSFGSAGSDMTFVVSPAAYTEGLLWPTIGANPPGAKAPGYASWAEPPRIPEP